MAVVPFKVPHTFTQLARAFPAQVSTNFQAVQRWLRLSSEVTAFAKTANQSVLNATNAAVTFASGGELSDDGGLWDSGTPSRFTFSEDCVASVGGEVQFASNAVGARFVWIRLNGVTRVASQTGNAVMGLATNIGCVSGPLEFSAGDYIELVAYQTSGGALNVQSASSTAAFWVKRIK